MTDSSKAEADLKKKATCSLEQLDKELGTCQSGLSNKEAAKRLREHGPNLLPEQRKLRLYQRLLTQFKNLFNVLLILAAILSFISGFTASDMTSINMGVAILAVVLISVVFSIFQERRAERAVEAIRDLVPRTAKVMRGSQVKQVPIADIVPGDVIILEEGDKIPADSRLIKCYEFSVDNSTLTGESEPQHCSTEVDAGELDKSLYRFGNLIFAGTTVASGTGTAVVLETGAGTEFGRIVAMASEIQEPPSPLQREIDRTAKLDFAAAIFVGVLFQLLAYFFLHLTLADSLLFMIGVMVCLVPEGFQVTLTLSLALSSLAMSKRNVIVKRLSSVETLGSCTVICSDKTGTITEGQMTVRYAWIGGKTLQVSGEGYDPEGAVFLDGEKLTVADRADLRALCEVAALDNTATLVPPLDRRKSRWTAIGDSTDASLLAFAAKAGIQYKQVLMEQPRIGMIPFESSRKMMTTVHREADGTVGAYVKGAGYELLAKSTNIYWNGKVTRLMEEMKAKVGAQIDAFARDAFRVLALARKPLSGEMKKYTSDAVEKELTFIGLVAIYDPPRSEAPEAVYKARSAGIRVVMITGDHELTAEAIARKVGIISSGDSAVMTGTKLAKLSDEELSKVLDTPELVFARTTPEQKLRIVRAFRSKGEIVAVTGDGVNDAPALLEADIGVAMGLSGTDVARESADMVLLDDNFASIVNGIEQGRAVFDNLKKFVVYVFCHNWAEMAAFIAFVILQTPLPLAVIQILAIDLLMDIPPSLSLTLEPPEPGIMERQPRRTGSRLFDLSALARSAYIGLLVGAVALFWCFQVWSQAGWHVGMTAIANSDIYLKGTAVVMTGIMAGQLGALFAMRTTVKSAFSVSPLRNEWLLGSIALELIILMVLVYAPLIGPLFYTSPLDPVYWLLLYIIAPVVLLCEEVRKFVLRRSLVPAKPVPAPLAVPAGVAGVEAYPAVRSGFIAKFVERAKPILLPVHLKPSEDTALLVSMTLGRQKGSRVVMVRLTGLKTPEWMPKRFDLQAQRYAADEVPYEYTDIPRLPKAEDNEEMRNALRKVVSERGVETIIFPVSRDAILGKRRALREIAWLNEFSGKRVILVSAGARPESKPAKRQFRILIPVLQTFQQGPFELAQSLSENAVIPDVDVVAAKVIEIPEITPLYSMYRPESLVDEEEELSFLKSLRGWSLLKVIHPKILLVRSIGRDLVDFAAARNINLIIMEGDWTERRHGFLTREEREIAARAECAIMVTLLPAKRKERKV